uniref:Ribosomal protein S14 n=1 Tax=Pteridomonas danica TaxID=38822 RepID=A0A7T1C5C8_9STRA|nr:ribosomal protein S14 [Pteridomonas danica]QPM99320.1 ribosomal protein S14 [Pteridomonas danica]
MSKKSILERSKKKYKLNKVHHIKRKEIKIKQKNEKNIIKLFSLEKIIQKLVKNSALTRFKRFCWVTGRNRGYYRDFSLSRHVLREFAHKGNLPGILKSSW